MSESILHESSAVPPRRGWLIAATVGIVMVAITLIVSVLITFDKTHFGSLVGTWFLPIITGGVWAGALLLLVSTFALPERKTWRGIVLILWALIALTSPLFGILFLFPWAVLAITLPIVIAILVKLFRSRQSYRLTPVSLDVQPGVNLDKALSLADEIEDEEIIRKLKN
ncbi:MAG: hypothetical protein QOE82_773 [Thermoanaerobaculia bacterium]|jgi:MFS family permease|nr:hypothetical protein [Thermoanaerobaculia bacterium]